MTPVEPQAEQDAMSLATDIAARFLQSVVLVDDRAFERTPELPPQAKLVVPGRGAEHEPQVPTIAETPATGLEGTLPADKEGVQPPAAPPPVVEPAAEALDAADLIKVFAKAGLVCAVIAPKPGESVAEETANAALRSDIVVVDWVLHGDHGSLALEIMQRILSRDNSRGGRLRLIVIYTGESDLRGIIGKVHAALAKEVPDLTVAASGLALTSQSLRIVVLAKEGARIPEEEPALRSVQVLPADLPRRLQSEFAGLTSGLVTGAAVHGLAALREDTHRLIATLGPQLDAAFLAHRVLLDDPQESIAHAVDLVVGEIDSLMHASDMNAICGSTAAIATVKGLKHDFKSVLKALGITPESLEELVKLVNEGYQRKNLKRKNVPLFTRLFADGENAATRSEADYAIAAMLITRYQGGGGSPIPLTLGTLVRKKPTGPTAEYLICLQPRCDAVRLTGERAFIFLPLEVGDEEYELMVRDGSDVKKLKYALAGVEVHRFGPSAGHSVVLAAKDDGGKLGFTTVDGNTLEWIGQLKPFFAQRLSNRFAAHMARVGLSEPEWLRRSGPER